MLNLKHVTLVSATTLRHEETIHALQKCLAAAEFRNVVIWTDAIRPYVAAGFYDANYLAMPTYSVGKTGYRQTSAWNLTHQARLLGTSPVFADYILGVQWDGFILNPAAWMDRFFEYDYIGAPWPPTFGGTGGRVGNGGFCLTSKRFWQAVADLHLPEIVEACFPSDIAMCTDVFNLEGKIKQFYLKPLLAAGMHYAPVDLAARFSSEDVEYRDAFGFHGRHVLAQVKARGLY